MDFDKMGQELYETYCADAGWLNYRGETCPQWWELSMNIKHHWIEVFKRARTLVVKELAK